MTKKEISVLSFKILSIYAVIHAIDKLPDIFYFFSRNSLNEAAVMNLLPKAVPLILIVVCGIFLWFGAPLLASLIFKSSSEKDSNEISLADIKVTAFSIVGLFIIASSLSDITQAQVIEFWVSPGDSGYNEIMSIKRGYIGLFLVKLVFGFWLFFGTRGIVNLIQAGRRD